jgi:hypothetical protein
MVYSSTRVDSSQHKIYSSGFQNGDTRVNIHPGDRARQELLRRPVSRSIETAREAGAYPPESGVPHVPELSFTKHNLLKKLSMYAAVNRSNDLKLLAEFAKSLH